MTFNAAAVAFPVRALPVTSGMLLRCGRGSQKLLTNRDAPHWQELKKGRPVCPGQG
jgi:hypothetical protein